LKFKKIVHSRLWLRKRETGYQHRNLLRKSPKWDIAAKEVLLAKGFVIDGESIMKRWATTFILEMSLIRFLFERQNEIGNIKS